MPRRIGPSPSRASDPRSIAHSVLERVDGADAFADVLLSHALDRSTLSGPDRALATELVYGVLTWQGRLDHHLAALVRGPLADLERPVHIALRLGLFQLLFLDRVPPYAAVDASVRLVGQRGPGARGLVNAVLRRASRLGRAGLVLPDPASDPVARLTAEWSYPRWLVERWVRELGPEHGARLLAAGNQRAPTTLRANVARTDPRGLLAELVAAGLVVTAGRFAETALVVERGAARLRDLAAYRDGRFAFQGEASQLVAGLADAPGDLLDACAGGGGKVLAIAERGRAGGRLVAMDVNAAALARLGREAARLGTPVPLCAVGDARHPPTAARFATVLVDAPCTGLGTLRQHPELRWRRRAEDMPRLATLQQAMLAGVAPLVRPGGHLVYAVCTLTPEETTEVVRTFLATHDRFVVEPITLPSVVRDGFLRTTPHEHGLDGFFAARLRARE